jgi:hypothetical protein
MKTLSDLLLSSTLAVATLTAVASGALAQASPPTATLPEASLEAVDPPCRVIRKLLASAGDTGNLRRICPRASGIRHAVVR